MTLRNALASALLGLGLVGAAVAVPVVTVGGTAVAGQGQTSSQAGVTVLDFNTDVFWRHPFRCSQQFGDGQLVGCLCRASG